MMNIFNLSTLSKDAPRRFERSVRAAAAAIALAFFCDRLAKAENRAVYHEIFERALYNNILAGESADGKGEKCNRFTFDYEPVNGTGHFLHTYEKDGSPLPTFMGEPERVAIPNDVNAFAQEIWESLDADNKISLYCRAITLRTWQEESVLINKFEK